MAVIRRFWRCLYNFKRFDWYLIRRSEKFSTISYFAWSKTFIQNFFLFKRIKIESEFSKFLHQSNILYAYSVALHTSGAERNVKNHVDQICLFWSQMTIHPLWRKEGEEKPLFYLNGALSSTAGICFVIDSGTGPAIMTSHGRRISMFGQTCRFERWGEGRQEIVLNLDEIFQPCRRWLDNFGCLPFVLLSSWLQDCWHFHWWIQGERPGGGCFSSESFTNKHVCIFTTSRLYVKLRAVWLYGDDIFRISRPTGLIFNESGIFGIFY